MVFNFELDYLKNIEGIKEDIVVLSLLGYIMGLKVETIGEMDFVASCLS